MTIQPEFIALWRTLKTRLNPRATSSFRQEDLLGSDER
jgi:hypothetical protein